MRRQLLKLTPHNSTKAERQFAETLKKYRVPFRAKVKIAGREIDFLVGDRAIEIDGHSQDVEKNYAILAAGFIPVHLFNREAKSEVTAQWLKELIHGRH